MAVPSSSAASVLEHAAILVIFALLSDWFVRVDKRALELNEALTVPPFGSEQLAIRDGLLRALRTMDVPVDAVIAAGQVGLTAVQAELLAYLMLGLTNIEISDASGLSEATVRYRLPGCNGPWVCRVAGRRPRQRTPSALPRRNRRTVEARRHQTAPFRTFLASTRGLPGLGSRA